MWHTVNI